MWTLVGCLKDALQMSEPQKYCVMSYDMYGRYGEFNAEQKKEFLVPCRALLGWLRMTESSPLSYFEQFEVAAINKGVVKCPLFCRDNFSGPVISERPSSSTTFTIKVHAEPECKEYKNVEAEKRPWWKFW